MTRIALYFGLLLMVMSSTLLAENKLKPFVLASTQQGEMLKIVEQTRSKLTANNQYQIAGEFSPYPGTQLLIITNDRLKQHAALSRFGGYGASIHVAITQTADGIQVSYNNPEYLANVYRMKETLTDVKDSLGNLLGNAQEYGSAKGLTAKDLRDYQYKFLMPDFEDKLELVRYPSYEVALQKVEAALKANNANVEKVYRIDIPGKKQTVFGVHMKGTTSVTECSGDKYIMDKIDFGKIKSSAHLPYEILVRDSEVVSLYAEFRIAISFPDLSMVGDNSFFSIMCAPSAINAALTKAVGGTLEN